MTAPLTPERLRLIRVVHEKFCEWCEQQMDCPVADLLAEAARLRAQVAEVEQQRDLAFRDGTIEAAEAILQGDFIGGSSYTLEKRVRERLAEYHESRAALTSGDEVHEPAKPLHKGYCNLSGGRLLPEDQDRTRCNCGWGQTGDEVQS